MVGSIQTREPQVETATSHYGFLLLSPSPTLTPFYSSFGRFEIVVYSTLARVSRENVVRETTSTCARKFLSPTKQKLFRSRLLVSADVRANQRRSASTSLMLRSLSTVPHEYHGFSRRKNVYKMVGSIQTREPQAKTATSHYGFLLLSPSPTFTTVPAAVESRPSPGPVQAKDLWRIRKIVNIDDDSAYRCAIRDKGSVQNKVRTSHCITNGSSRRSEA
ncbi:hypothetical protein PoB_002390600 [Plakobranchus ocellatus]|uniref:Ig-like domain-containing protein n=1 Tax=Plakobranchus ocellatus TaxID=259542 RepID=A0AAV3ZDU3_9GAST|nr:hypothetical protein PoB_002390600 [Plakobranchus ocellatus]